MSRRVTIPYHLVAGPGAEGTVSIYSVPPGQVLALSRIQVRFPSGTAGELEISLLHGNMRLWPEERPATGDDVLYEKELSGDYRSGESILLAYRNLNATASRDAYVQVEGELR